MTAPRITLIHAVAVAMPPVHAAFAAMWPDAKVFDLFDSSLSPDRALDEELTPAMSDRIGTLARYAAETGSDGILYTCSAFGPAIEAAARSHAPLPVLKPNEAMFHGALSAGKRIGMLATFGPSVSSMEAEFAEAAAGTGAVVETVLVEPAMAALRAGDGATHDRLLAEAAPRLRGCDAVMLAHFSTSRARAAVQAMLPGTPVLTSPEAAVRALRERLAA
ncbi:aspartate/glutamate racemase family protein [Muricoccus radiodurans]|uniref:aspartate/glutamate racemase family protein n=1 Tax=Muricoccus radiodurans TaxID=2231721 RepID=UPI003CF08A0D